MTMQASDRRGAIDVGVGRTNIEVLIELLDLVEAMESDYRLPAGPIPDLEFPSLKQMLESRKALDAGVKK